MLTDDYLIRMINLAVAALLQVIGLKKAGNYQDALLLIDLTFERLLGLTTGMAKNLDDERLYYLLTRGDTLDTQRLALVAELFLHEGDIYAATGRAAESRQDYTRALKYSLEVHFQGGGSAGGEQAGGGQSSEDPPPAHATPTGVPPSADATGRIEQQIEWLARSLGLADLPPDVLWPLAGYYEESGALASAEEALLALADRPEVSAEIAPEVAAFYRRLSEKPPGALAAGGLDMARVRAGLERWQNP